MQRQRARVRLPPIRASRPPAARALTACALVGCALAACALPRYGKPGPDPAGALFVLERDLFTAIQKKDVAALRLLLADEFVLRVPGSPDTPRDPFIAGLVGLKGTLEVTGEGIDARIVGETGVITGVQHGRAHLDGGRVVDDVQAFTDLAVKRDGRWQVVLSHSAPLAPGR